MATQNNIEQQLMDLLVTKNFQPEMKDKNGQDARDTADAKLLTFDYVGSSGKNYGTMVIVLDQDNDLKIMYGDNLGRTMVGDDKDEFFDFIVQVNQIANRNRWTHTVTDLSKLKYVQQGLAAIQEGLFEGYYGTRKISYTGEPTEARLMIKHNHVLGENDKRYRYVESLYIETVDSERFKLGFKNLAGGHAMLEHVRQGGKPYDIRGNHITEMIGEIAVLNRFNRASAGRVMEGVTAELITEAQHYYKSLREDIKRMGNSRGYTKYFESWHPAVIAEQEGLVEDIKTMFIEQTLDARIEAALPVLARLQQGKTMKEADIFEAWTNRMVEGTWAMPETPEARDKLDTMLMSELPVGPDASNVTEQLYDVLGDDELFDRLAELAREDANADARPVIIARMEEMGMKVPDITSSDQGAETAPDEMAPISEGDNLATFEAASCNMTMEGDYCPEHGLMECGGMYEDDSGSFKPSPVAQAITRRILSQRIDLLKKYGPEKVMSAIDDVADFVGDVEEIGSSDVSGWVRQVEQSLGNMEQGMAEAAPNTLSDIRARMDARRNPAAATPAAQPAAPVANQAPKFKVGDTVIFGIGRGIPATGTVTAIGPGPTQLTVKTAEGENQLDTRMKSLYLQLAPPAAAPSIEPAEAQDIAPAAAPVSDFDKPQPEIQTPTGASNLPRATMSRDTTGQAAIQYDGNVYDPSEPYAKVPEGTTGTQVLVPAAAFGIRSMGDVVALLTNDGTAYAEQPIKIVQPAMKPSVKEQSVNDPINYNAAITGSYYEAKEDPLARIKSLALRK